MEVASHSPHSILCYKRSMSSLSPLFTHKGLSVGCSPCRRPVFGKLTTHAGRSVLCFAKKPVGISWYNVDAKEEFLRSSNDVRLHDRKKLVTRTIVRSGLVETGSPDGALPEVNIISKVRGVCFYVIAAFNAIYLFALMVVAHPFVMLFDRYRRRAHAFIAKIWATFAVTPFLKVEVEGLENLPPPDVPAVYVSNHQSFLDIYVLLTIGRPYKFISKTSIFLIPIIGWAMFLIGVIPLRRMDSKSQLECLKRCIYLLNKGSSVFFFPEGTRSKDGKLGDFKKGAFSLAAKTKVPVVPITLIGTGNIMPVGKESILNTGPVKVIVHKPIEGSNAETLSRESRSVIEEALSFQGRSCSISEFTNNGQAPSQKKPSSAKGRERSQWFLLSNFIFILLVILVLPFQSMFSVQN